MNLNIKIPVFPSESEGDFHLKYAYPIHFSYPKLIIFIIFSILLLGIPILLLFWLELLHRKFLYVFCEPEKLTHLLLKHEDDTFEISKIEQIFINLQKIHIFKVRQMTYILDKDPKNYTIKLMEYTIDKNCSEIIKMKGLTDLESKFNLKIYGQCLMDVPIPSIPMFFIKEILHPFFIFQFFSVIVWMVESYALFAILILLISIFTAFMNLFTSRKNLIKLKKMAFHFSDVMVYRQENSDFIIIDSRNLVPGDLMVIEKKTILPCDLLLISGDVLINECSLTGESMPIIKTNLPNNQNKYFDISEKNHILYCGTEVLQVKPLIREKFVLGIVYKTGYNTMKGNLLRSILYPKQNIFRFFEESIKFILVISIITVIGFLIVLPRLFEIMNTGQLILKFLDIITVAIPPSLPAAINVGISFALTRLKDKNIFCIQPHKVVIGGRVNMVCFDKTGTITEDTMKFIGVKIVKNNIFIDGDDIENIDLNKNLLYNAMASCHNLISFIDNENKLSLFGDLMEIQMFKYVNAEFHEDFIIRNNFKIKILKKYEFTSETQRMSVLVQEENSQFLYIKGSPEIIKERCLIESLPSNYNEILDEIAQKGFRILAIGYVDFKIEIPESELENISRNAMESKIKFLGFILLDNPIKPEANSTIEELNKANIGVKMLTGDNPLTAINVAREIGIIKKNEEIYLADFDTEKKKLIYKHISLNKEKEIDNNKSVINEEKNNEELIPILESQINYKTFVPNEKDFLFNELLSNIRPNEIIAMTGLLLMELFSSFQMGEKKKFNQKLMDQIKVFGRVKPKQKTQIITILQEAGYCIAMVGDGANDCGALKQADIGLALSEAEASVTSPFTSKDLRIGSLLDLLKDARAGLVTSFQCFKYMAFYSLTQYITIILLYYKFTTLSDSQFLYIDLLIVCPLFITMSMTGPCKNLSTNRPRDSLFSIGTIFSVFGLLIIQFIGQFSILFMINYELDKNDEENINYFKKYNNLKLNTYESDSLFIFSNFLYIGGMLAFSMGRPFRKPFYSNWVFTINIIIITTYNILIIFVKKSRFYELEINQEIKNNWGWCIVGLGFIWMIIMILFEQIICEKLLRRFEKDNFLK